MIEELVIAGLCLWTAFSAVSAMWRDKALWPFLHAGAAFILGLHGFAELASALSTQPASPALPLLVVAAAVAHVARLNAVIER